MKKIIDVRLQRGIEVLVPLAWLIVYFSKGTIFDGNLFTVATICILIVLFFLDRIPKEKNDERTELVAGRVNQTSMKVAEFAVFIVACLAQSRNYSGYEIGMVLAVGIVAMRLLRFLLFVLYDKNIV